MTRLAERIGRRIKELRTGKGLSQERLAELCELSTSYVSMLERGERLPTVATLVALTDACGSSLSELFQDFASEGARTLKPGRDESDRRCVAP